MVRIRPFSHVHHHFNHSVGLFNIVD